MRSERWGARSCGTVKVMVRTLDFLQSEMGSHWRDGAGEWHVIQGRISALSRGEQFSKW